MSRVRVYIRFDARLLQCVKVKRGIVVRGGRALRVDMVQTPQQFSTKKMRLIYFSEEWDYKMNGMCNFFLSLIRF